MTPKKYKYYFINEAGQYYYVDENNIVKATTTKTALKTSPKNWKEQKIKMGRHLDGFGFIQEVTGELQFYGDAKKILSHIFYDNSAGNYNAFCRILIEKRIDAENNVWSYKTWFEGFIDFTQFVNDAEDEDKIYCQVRCYSDGAAETIDANRNKEYEIPLTGITESKTINMQGVQLQGLHEWRAGNIGAQIFQGQGGGAAQCYVFPMGLVEVDSTNYFRNLIYLQSQGFNVSIIGGGTPNTEGAEFLRNTQIAFSGTISLNVSINWSSTNPSPLIRCVLLKQRISDGQLVNAPTFSHDFYNSGVMGVTGGSISFSDTHTEAFTPYSFRYLIAFVGDGATATYTIEVTSAEMTLTYNEALPDTDTAALRFYDYARLLVDKASEGQLTLQSTYLKTSAGDLLYKYYDLLPYNEFITSGDALRQLDSPTIKGTLNALLNDVAVRYMCGWRIEGDKFIIERLDDFFRKNEKIATIRAKKVLEQKPAVEYLHNAIKVGYPQYKANDLNGRFEVNSQQQYSIGYKNIKPELNLTTSYKASVYEIEYLRSAVFDEQTRDKDNDNSIYLLYCNPSPSNNKYTLKKHASGVVGVPNPSSHYNIEHSPQRFIWRNLPYFKSIMNIRDGFVGIEYKIEFISGERNTNFRTQINGAPPGNWIDESDSVYPAQVPASKAQGKLFIPVRVDVLVNPDNNLAEQIEENPYGYLEVIHSGGTFRGFLIDGEFTGSETEVYKLTLLLAPEQDTAQFSRI